METRQLVTFKELLAIEFECECGATSTHPIETLQNLPHRCQNCMRDLIRDQAPEEQSVKRFITAVREIAQLQKPRIRIQVAGSLHQE